MLDMDFRELRKAEVQLLRTPLMRQPGEYDEGRVSSHPSCGPFRIGTVLVATRSAVQQGEHQQHYRSDQWHQPDQYPPARAIYVVEPPYGHGQGRDEDRQAVDPAQQPRARIGSAGAKQGVDPPQHYGYYDVEEHEVPVLPASGPATEDRVLLECFEIPAQPKASPSPRLFARLPKSIVACCTDPRRSRKKSMRVCVERPERIRNQTNFLELRACEVRTAPVHRLETKPIWTTKTVPFMVRMDLEGPVSVRLCS